MEQKLLPSRKKHRLETFLYKEGSFFVTINVQDHMCVFGEVINDEMKLNVYGKIAEECRYDLPNHYSNCELGSIIIMPNHLHAIINVEKNDENVVREGFKPSPTRKYDLHEGSEGFKPSPTRKYDLHEIIRGFKTFSSRKLHESGLTDFKRQRSFYDHIIRNEADLQRIQEYIELNPYKRENDEYYIG